MKLVFRICSVARFPEFVNAFANLANKKKFQHIENNYITYENVHNETSVKIYKVANTKYNLLTIEFN